MKIGWGLLRATLIFPLNNYIVIPAVILWWTGDRDGSWLFVTSDQLFAAAGLLLIAAGGALMLWTVALFASIGGGTPNPTEPPTSLVIRGPYRYCRNPMMLGGVITLLGESLLTASWPLVVWAGIYAVIYAAYGLLFEERGLERRFGQDYFDYKRHVPRWLPRPTPWPPDDAQQP